MGPQIASITDVLYDNSSYAEEVDEEVLAEIKEESSDDDFYYNGDAFNWVARSYYNED